MSEQALRASMLFFFTAWSAAAAPAIYIFRALATGTMDGTVFTNKPFTLTVQGDTADVADLGSGVFRNDLVTTSVTIAGIATFSMTDPDYAFANNNPTVLAVGFGLQRPTHCCDIIALANGAYASYDLKHPLGPISTQQFNWAQFNFVDVPTTMGLLTVRSMSDNSFQAIIVPEPRTGSLIGPATLLYALLMRRRLR